MKDWPALQIIRDTEWLQLMVQPTIFERTQDSVECKNFHSMARFAIDIFSLAEFSFLNSAINIAGFPVSARVAIARRMHDPLLL